MFGIVAIPVMAILSFRVAHGQPTSDPDGMQRMIEYAESFSLRSDDVRARVVFDLLLRGAAHRSSSDDVATICAALTSSVPADAVSTVNRSFWNCPESVLVSWLGDLSRFESVAATRIFQSGPGIEWIDGAVPGRVEVLFDIGPDGRLSNIRIVSSTDRRLTNEVGRMLARWRYRPATFRGAAVATSDVPFTFRFELDE